MATTAPVTTTSTLGTLIQSILTAVKNDAIAAALPVINTFFQAVIANPSPANVTAQVALLQVQLLAALPNLEMAVIKDVAALVQAEVATLAAQATAAKIA